MAHNEQYQAHMRTAYLLWLPSLFGISGLHRLYLGKYVSGIIYLLTFGIGGIGTLYDLFAMRSLINTKILMDESSGGRKGLMEFFNTFASASEDTASPHTDSLEVAILEHAKEHDGIIRLVDLVIKTKLPVDQIEKTLNELMKNNIIEIHVNDDGNIIYFCREFMSPGAKEKYQI